ncbi:MAG: hypothetical protein AAGH82_06075 [Pseudomonadota bacterium]
MNWRWMLTPGEPRMPWILMTAIMTFMLMFVTRPFWVAGGPVTAAIAAMFAVAVSAVSSKLILEKRK